MSDASEEMVKQLGLYADTITALATVQLLGFIYLIAQGGCFSEGVLTAINLSVGIGFGVSAGYMGLVCLCHRRGSYIRNKTRRQSKKLFRTL